MHLFFETTEKYLRNQDRKEMGLGYPISMPSSPQLGCTNVLSGSKG
jgi:hypothetical protein